MNSTKHELSVLTGNYSGASMKFWGISCVGGKAYKQVVNSRFYLTMAVLDPKSFDRDASGDRTVTLSLIHHGRMFILCVLKHDKIQQVSLDLIFDKGDNVTFIVDGKGTVHLSGYQLVESFTSTPGGIGNEPNCPVAEVGSEKMIHKELKSSMNGVGTVKTEKAMSIRAILGGDDEDDEDDSDFSVKEVEVEEEEEESDSEYEDSDEIEIDEEEIKDVLQEVAEMETPPRLEKSQKRNLGSMSQKRKRENSEFGKNDDVNDDDGGDSDDNVHMEEIKSDSDAGQMDSSIGNTPMPEQLDNSAKAKKKNKKRKRLSEISNLGVKSEMTDDQSPKNKSTPKQKKGDNVPTDGVTPKKKENKIKHPVIKLEGGVEVQDVIVGRGPIAANGKIVSVFYMGRLENHKIFDSRLPPKKPFSFKLGVPEVIKGLDIGIKGMRVGGQRKLRIPPNMGYGSKKITDVPSNSTLFFTVELQSVN